MSDEPRKNGKHDVWTHRIAAAAVALTVLVDITLMGILAAKGDEIPVALPAIGFSALTALTSMVYAIMQRPDTNPTNVSAPKGPQE
jgi:hypothetical protein